MLNGKCQSINLASKSQHLLSRRYNKLLARRAEKRKMYIVAGKAAPGVLARGMGKRLCLSGKKCAMTMTAVGAHHSA
jgi:hypothetical protein